MSDEGLCFPRQKLVAVVEAVGNLEESVTALKEDVGD